MSTAVHPHGGQADAPPADPVAAAQPGRRRVPLRPTCAQPHQCPLSVRMKVLGQVPLFAGLTHDELVDVERRMVSLSWAQDDPICSAGERAEHVYVLAAGRAKSSRLAANGQEIVVDLLAPGDLFGGMSTHAHATYPETVRALTTTCALRMTVRAFRDVLTEHPPVALRVIDDTTALLAQARRDVTEQSTATVAQRVATTLLRLADTFGQDGVSGDTLIQLPLTRTDLAGMTGSTPESVSRAMSRLRQDGIIDSGRRWTAILDRDRLRATIST